MRIYLTDNNPGQPDVQSYSRKDVAVLFPIAGKTVEQLCRENEHLLIFPYSLDEADDRIGDLSVIGIQNTDDPERVVITTGNMMGFIGIGSLQLKIQSRFDDGRDDYLLHYMLQKVLSFNVFDLDYSKEQEEVLDLAMFMFPGSLANALRQGVYKEYRSYKRNDTRITGVLEFGRHLANNVPFNGNIAYTAREYSYDNDMTQLIRHTIEFMKTKQYGLSVLNRNYGTIENVKTIVEYTPSYQRNERLHVVNKNLRQKVHPYYSGYQPLRSLCLQILRMEEIRYGESDDEISGILFDGAWLWEEYVNTLLCHQGFLHPENRKKTGRICLFTDGSGFRYPDFYKDNIVLDAKYKRLGDYRDVAKIGRDDIHQMISYIVCLQANMGGFVAPLKYKQPFIPKKKIKGTSATLSIFGIEISKNAGSYASFCKEMEKLEADFLHSLVQG